MIRFMIDTDDLSKLTQHAEILATYADLVPNLAALQAKYPASKIVLIDRGLGDPEGKATIFDIEPGALTIAQAVAKYDDAKSRGLDYLTAYHDRAEANAVKAGFGDRKPWHWYATLDGTAHITGYNPLMGPAVIQVLASNSLDYRADGSLVFEDGWHPTNQHADIQAAITAATQANNGLIRTLDDLHKLAALIGG